jgi:hypothetical protein
MVTNFIEKCKTFCGTHAHKVIAILSSSERVLVSCVLYLWLASWVTKAWEHVGRAQHFHGNWTASLEDWGVAAAILILIRVVMIFERREQCTVALNHEWNRILARSRILCGLRVAYFLASSMILSVFFCFFAVSSFDQGAKSLACLLSDVNQYELAERVYRLAPDLDHNRNSGRYNSMAAWHSSSTCEDPDTVQRKNAAVAAVYGSQSREMAGRFFYLGLTCENKGTRTGELEAIYWHKKAYLLYQHNHAITKCVDALTQIAIFQDGFNKPEFKRTIAQAARLVPQLDEEPFVSTPMLLPYYSKRDGDDEQAKLFKRGLEKRRSMPESPLWALTAIVLLALFGSRFGGSLVKALVLKTLTTRMQQTYQRATNSHAQFELLNELVTLNLLRRNLQGANEQSVSMLAIAEGRQSSSMSEESLTSIQKSLGIELFRTLFAVAIWTFF